MMDNFGAYLRIREQKSKYSVYIGGCDLLPMRRRGRFGCGDRKHRNTERRLLSSLLPSQRTIALSLSRSLFLSFSRSVREEAKFGCTKFRARAKIYYGDGAAPHELYTGQGEEHEGGGRWGGGVGHSCCCCYLRRHPALVQQL